MRFSKPNRQRVRRVQQRGHKLRRCRRYKHWKQKIETREAAEGHARDMQRRFPQYIYNAFECQYCGYYHVGRDMERQIRDLEREVERLRDIIDDKDNQLTEAREENLGLRQLLGEYERSREINNFYATKRLADSCDYCGSSRRTCPCGGDGK